MDGVLLAGGTGSRLRPLTASVCKQLLPVYDKPMVFYPLSLLMLAGVRRTLVITTPRDHQAFVDLLGDGSAWGTELAYAVQDRPAGIAQALTLAEGFLAGRASMLVLGDNLLYGEGLTAVLRRMAALERGAHVLGYPVADPTQYGVLAFEGERVVDLVEKPADPPSRFAVPGLYAYDGTAPARVASQAPSARGELEITDLNRSYLADGQLEVSCLGRGVAWLDMGTPASLHEAAGFVQTLQARQGYRVGCPEEVAWRQGWIDDEALLACAAGYRATEYGAYLERLVEEGA
ncbi:MAG: glucose-1-phosphate thymidylyltransferase RfbA [Alphaproteobacteria bacterium]|nr:glucose-1-phosphate thymidylyltransferase RfbA [Alphaproteobacteria bacterium]